MKIRLVTEVYPPRAGGAGWSTQALALALHEAGHDVTVVTTSHGPEEQAGLRIVHLASEGRRRFAVPRVFTKYLREHPEGLVHAQHSLSALGSLVPHAPWPTVVTVRDHWPLCFWSTRISRDALCPHCGVLPMLRCVTGKLPVGAPLSWTVLPYMRWDLAAKVRALARAKTVLAVSEAIAGELRGHTTTEVEVLPNIVDPEETRRVAAAEPIFPLPDRFLLFVGKLETNKGAHLLVPAIAAARTGLPLVVLGEGSLYRTVKHEALARDVQIIQRGWVHREDTLRVLARATALVFPSLWPEPLSRVILEAQALGTPIAAMDTGGTREILRDNESGLLVRSADELTEAVARIASDAALRARLREGARHRALDFAPAALVPRYEAVYRRWM
ncbi:MAG: glycosyltransferase family 4 protein [Vicinamibacteria bacterium]|jgi:glycosyltransferase involved in cell wall biosynthesis|nr:glycosyltransferase family 4 protein [Vicinamibacteria bacterium]